MFSQKKFRVNIENSPLFQLRSIYSKDGLPGAGRVKQKYVVNGLQITDEATNRAALEQPRVAGET